MSNIRTIQHSVNLIAEFDLDKMPADIAMGMMMIDEKQLNSVLAKTFISSLNHIGAFDILNENNNYAKIKAGNN